MDNLCHTLAGAALGEAGLKRRTAFGMGTLMIASNLPDIDVAVFATDLLPMAFRRGWTHGVLALVILPALFAAIVVAGDRIFRWRRVNVSGVLLLSYVATWLHVFMDWLNSYGVRLLMPFSNRWFYGDALYIIDPLLYVIFGAALAASRVMPRMRSKSAETAGALREGRQTDRRLLGARIGLAVAGAYMLLMLAASSWARVEVSRGLERAGRAGDTRFMVTPVFGNPFRREVVIDVGERYEKGLVWFEPLPHFRPLGYGVDTNAHHPLAQQAAATAIGRGYLMWSRFPFFVIHESPGRPRVQLNDYRYAGPGGRDTWLSATVELPAN